MALLLTCRADDERLALDAVPQVAARVPHRRVWLDVARSVGSPHREHVPPWSRRRPRVLPGPEGIWPVVSAERRLHPVPPVVLRELDLHHRALAAERNALDPHRQPRQTF